MCITKTYCLNQVLQQVVKLASFGDVLKPIDEIGDATVVALLPFFQYLTQPNAKANFNEMLLF